MEASSVEEQIRTLREYIALVPKHKGTENLLYNLKKRLSKLEYDLEKKLEKAKKGRASTSSPYSIKKEGAGQIVLIGTTNSGKSTFLNTLTNVKAEVGVYDFTTKLPELGMLEYEDVKIQMVELPALFEHMNVKQGNGRQILSAIRNTDAILLLIDISTDPIAQMDLIVSELESANVRLNRPKLPVVIEKTGQGGIVVVFQGKRIEGSRKDIVDLLLERKIHNAIIKIADNCTLSDIIDALNANLVSKKAIIIANKGDIEMSRQHFQALIRQYAKKFPIHAVSALKKIGVMELKKEIYQLLEVIRVYTKEPGKDVSPNPIVLPKESVVQDVARRLHNKFFKNFKYAKIYRPLPQNPRRLTQKQVGLNYELEDKDIIQFYT